MFDVIESGLMDKAITDANAVGGGSWFLEYFSPTYWDTDQGLSVSIFPSIIGEDLCGEGIDECVSDNLAIKTLQINLGGNVLDNTTLSNLPQHKGNTGLEIADINWWCKHDRSLYGSEEDLVYFNEDEDSGRDFEKCNYRNYNEDSSNWTSISNLN